MSTTTLRWHMTAVALLMLGVAPAVAGQEPQGLDVVLRALERQGQVDYQGLQVTVLTNGSRRSRTEQVVKFRRPNLLRIEYSAPPRLHGDVVLDDGVKRRHYVRRLGVVEEAPPMARVLRPSQRRQIVKAIRSGALQVVLEGEETVAGRRVYVVAFTPTAGARPRRKLWLDIEHGVPLRVVQTGPGGRVSDTTFLRIQFSPGFSEGEFTLPAPAGAPTVTRGTSRVVSMEEAERIARKNWGQFYQIRRLPRGFTLQRVMALEYQGRPVVHLRYGNGRRGVSLFQSAGAGPAEAVAQAPLGVEGERDERPFVLQLTRGRARLALVGSFAPARLQKLADAIE